MPLSHSDFPTSINLRAFIRAARLNTLLHTKLKLYTYRYPPNQTKPNQTKFTINATYHLSGLFSKTKSTH
ncbi:hypothetical protein Hanom_Chr14g01317101 [Helianthus anomalus]